MYSRFQNDVRDSSYMFVLTQCTHVLQPLLTYSLKQMEYQSKEALNLKQWVQAPPSRQLNAQSY